MGERAVLVPNEAHPITVEPNPRRVVVRAGGRVVADTRAALLLREASYPPVQYVPKADVDMAQLEPSTRVTHCPYKGDASYHDLPALGERGAGAVWCYERPHPAVAAIAGHLAFYPDRVEIAEEAEGT